MCWPPSNVRALDAGYPMSATTLGGLCRDAVGWIGLINRCTPDTWKLLFQCGYGNKNISLYYPLDFCSLESLTNPWDEAIKNFFQQIRLPIVCENFVMWKKLCLWTRALMHQTKKEKTQKNGGQCSNYIPYSSCCMPNAEYLADTLILKQRIVPCEQLNGMSLWDP